MASIRHSKLHEASYVSCFTTCFGRSMHESLVVYIQSFLILPECLGDNLMVNIHLDFLGRNFMTVNHKTAMAVVTVLFMVFALSASGQDKLEQSIKQLRDSIGVWSVTTETIRPDGTVGNTLNGTYEFEWVIPDRVISGKSQIPELNQISAILFYIDRNAGKIEMVSVSGDGKLWIMSGALGEETRTTQEYETRNGQKSKMRFTRYNISHDKFESKMEYTSDNGKTWTLGNHQVFTRMKKSKS